MHRKIRNILAVLSMALSASCLMSFAVKAETSYTPVTGGSVDVDVMLAMDKSAVTPAETFSFKIEAGEAKQATSGNARIFAGPVVKSGSTVTAPTIGTAVFTAGQTQYNTAQNTMTTGQNKSGGTTIQVIPTSLPGGGTFNPSEHVFSHSKTTINFGGISFNEPGIYRYKITETSVNPAQGIVLDTNAKYIDVYVRDTEAATPALQVSGYVLHDSPSDMAVSGTNPSGKAIGFTNLYKAYDLRINKTVTGNAGSRDEYFEFTVNITNAQPGTQYRVGGNYDAAVPANATIGAASHTNPANVTVPAGQTSVTQKFYIQNGQYIILQGLADGTKYTIAENDATLNGEGYTTTIDVGSSGASKSGRTVTGPNAGIKADSVIAYTNTRNNAVPTGIIETVLPGFTAAVISTVGIILFSKNRRKATGR